MPEPRIDALAPPPAERSTPRGERITDIKAVVRRVTLPLLTSAPLVNVTSVRTLERHPTQELVGRAHMNAPARGGQPGIFVSGMLAGHRTSVKHDVG